MDIPLEAQVEGTDGHLGTVSGLVTEPDSGQITHFVLLEGHLLSKREITLPAAAVDRVEGETVYLKLDKHAVRSLPALPVKSDEEEPTQVELLARVFDDTEKAGKALESLEDWNRLHSLKLHATALLVKDEQGDTSIKTTSGMHPLKGSLLGAFAGALAGLVAGPAGVVVGGLAGAGAGGVAGARVDKSFSKEFLERAQEHLQPGTSAFIIIVERDSVQSLNQVMAGMEGVVLQQTITDTLVEELLQESQAEE